MSEGEGVGEGKLAKVHRPLSLQRACHNPATNPLTDQTSGHCMKKSQEVVEREGVKG